MIELTAGPVRIGRGAHCEVRLTDPGLGDVQCMLRRRGSTWHYQPVGPAGQVWIDDHGSDHQRPLPLGVPFRVGEHWLVLRPADSAFNDWGSFDTPISVEPVAEPEPTPTPNPGSSPPPAPLPDEAAERLRRWEARLDQRERMLKDRQDERRWEARWKSAGETLRARSTPPTPSPTPPPRKPVTPNRHEPTRPSTGRMPERPSQTPPVARIIEPRPSTSPRRYPEPITPRATPPREVIRPAADRPPVAVEPRAVEAERTPVAVSPPAAPTSRALVILAPRLEPAREASPTPPSEPSPTLTFELPPEPAEPVVEATKVPTLRESSPWGDEPGVIRPQTIERPEMRREVAEPSPVAPAEAGRSDVVPSPRADWPSARDIFAAQGRRAEVGPSRPTEGRKKAREPQPTDAMGPAVWSLPFWLGGFPVLLAALVLGSGGLALAFGWTVDRLSADRAIRLATRPEGTPGGPIDLSLIPRGGWWTSSATHRSAWALALARATDGEDHGEEIRELLESSRGDSTLGARARFVAEWPAPTAEPGSPASVAHLGRSRDVATLVWTGRRLRQEGKVESAIRAYRSAMEIASKANLDDLDAPVFFEDSQVRRYALPREALMGLVAKAMAEDGEWTLEQWAEALPPTATASMVASRVLSRLKKRAEADALADRAIRQVESPESPGFDPAEDLAAGAEALAYRGRWTDAADPYRRAIDLAGTDAIRRMWWLNLAEVSQRAGDDAGRARAIESARSTTGIDEITRRALRYQQSLPGLASSGSRP
jgi:tetratricopeptide (TPR) repeat protein